MSILALLVVVGVATAKSVRNQGNDAALRPMTSASQSRRICAELCLVGLGGEPCGESCLQVMPRTLSPQLSTRLRTPYNNCTRRDACPLLCANGLGRPLCECETVTRTRQASAGHGSVDFTQICSFFCHNYNHKISGCKPCRLYKDAAKASRNKDVFEHVGKSESVKDVDWNEWCREQCEHGDGGSACNCDMLPMALTN